MTGGIPPYLPSLSWCLGEESSDAAHSGRSLTRTLIESNTPAGQMLTVPVVGGSAAVKSRDPRSLRVSAHGDWTRIHLGAIEAAYGREPYFTHFHGEIAEIIAGYPPKLSDLNTALIRVLLRLLDYDGETPAILSLQEKHPERLKAIRGRMLSEIDPRHSIIEPVYRFGKDTLFLLAQPGCRMGGTQQIKNNSL